MILDDHYCNLIEIRNIQIIEKSNKGTDLRAVSVEDNHHRFAPGVNRDIGGETLLYLIKDEAEGRGFNYTINYRREYQYVPIM